MQSRALHNSTQKTRTVHRPCKNRAAVLQENKKAMKSFDFTAFFGAMEGTRTPGLLIRRNQKGYFVHLPRVRCIEILYKISSFSELMFLASFA